MIWRFNDLCFSRKFLYIYIYIYKDELGRVFVIHGKEEMHTEFGG